MDTQSELQSVKSLSEVSEPAGSVLDYGFGKWRPRGLQFLNNIKMAVLFLSLANCLQNATNGLLGVSISTLEKRFNFTSLMSSMIASAYEFGQVPAVLFIMIYANKMHRPMFFGAGMVCVGVGCMLFFLPQFMMSPYIPSFLDYDEEAEKVDLCVTSKLDKDFEPCMPAENRLTRYLPLFTLGRFLIGLGAAPVLTIGIAYINDCATKEDFALYSGIYNAMSIVGPGIGVLLSSFLLNVYVDFYRIDVNSLGFDDDDPRWVGNWWMAYVFLSFLSILCAVPLFGFPNDLPGAKQIREDRAEEAAEVVMVVEVDKFAVVRKVRRLMRNMSFILSSIFGICEMFIIIGFNSFGPKIFENLLVIPPHVAGIVFGMVLLPSGMVGTILGGVMIQKYKLSCKSIIRIQTILSIIALALFPCVLMICEPVKFAGANYPTSKFSLQLGLENICNEPCFCSDVEYQPVCDRDGVQFFSPCHAGCKDRIFSESQNLYELHNCSCISMDDDGMADAVTQSCGTNSCKKAIGFLLCFAIIVCLMFVCFTMNVSILLRVVKASQATAAISFQVLLTKLLGTIPAPIMFGATIDMSCAVWESLPCEESGTKCIFFYTEQLSRNVMLVCMGPKLVATIALIVLNVTYNPAKKRKKRMLRKKKKEELSESK